jgi:hypothetical protein
MLMAFQRRSTRLEFPRIWSDAPFGHQRRRRDFWIPVSRLVMGPLVSTEISQPAPQARCIGFGPGEPCSQAFGIGGTETAVGHSAALSVRDQSSRPSPTTAIFEQRSTYGDRLESSGISVSMSSSAANLDWQRRLLLPCPTERTKRLSDHFDAVRFRTLLPRLLGEANPLVLVQRQRDEMDGLPHSGIGRGVGAGRQG